MDLNRTAWRDSGTGTPVRRKKAFGIFYTCTIGGAASPVIYGLLSDTTGVPAAMVIVAVLVLATLLLLWQINKHLL